ncbi:hypothetical protein PSHT_07970 [Puccinia striiformis]|uniref:DUF6818 domain-containing protein n=1 Tax=Puccinia striiformis TaxID=27350 RepID=A0A2S4VTF0_9BASI|nr:hypothetical protein PSHT_07970 [Puccinia striiformis]
MPPRRQPQAPRSQQNQTIPTQSQQQSGTSNTTASQSIATQSEENSAEPQSNPQDEQSNTSKDTQKSQKGAGRAPGSQGYNDNDSRALVRAIKEVLPLGANEWSRVVDMYNDYAQKNQRAFRDEKSIRNKFKGLHSARKPTGDPMIKDFIRDAKAAFEEMRARAARYENVDVDEDEDEEYRDYLGSQQYESDDERNGVGADLSNGEESLGSLLSGWSDSQLPRDQQMQSDGAAESGWSATPTQRRYSPLLNGDDDLPDVDDLGSINSSRQTSQSGGISSLQSSLSSTRSYHASTQHRATPRNDRATTRNPLVHRADSSRPVDRNTLISQTARRSRTSNSDGLCETLQGYFDPTDRRERQREEGMTAFYVNRLQEANNTNTRLTDENRHLRDGINATIACLTEENHKLQHGVNTQILQLQDNKRRLQDEKTNLAIELQGLRSQLQLNQLRAEWQYGPQQFYHSQPNGMFQGAGMGGPGYMNMNPTQMANNSFPNDASYAPERGSAAASRPGPLADD